MRLIGEQLQIIGNPRLDQRLDELNRILKVDIVIPCPVRQEEAPLQLRGRVHYGKILVAFGKVRGEA